MSKRVNTAGEYAGQTRIEFSDRSAVLVSKAAARAIAPHLYEAVGIEFILPDGRRVPADLADGAKPTVSERDAAALELARHIVSYPDAARGLGDREHARYVEREGLAQRVLDLYSAGTEAPKPAEQAPFIDLKAGDEVAWPTAGKGTVRRVFEGLGGRLVAEVEIGGGWHTDPTDGCLTREDTGIPATLEIRAADLSRREG